MKLKNLLEKRSDWKSGSLHSWGVGGKIGTNFYLSWPKGQLRVTTSTAGSNRRTDRFSVDCPLYISLSSLEDFLVHLIVTLRI